jgi:DNA-binding NtrC family response regulator
VAEINGWKPRPFTAEAFEELRRYPWPGNVRELRNVVERLMLLADEVDAETVRLALSGRAPAALAAGSGSLAERVDAFEREALLEELRRHEFRMAETARALGLERSHLYKKCQQHGIDLQALKKVE